MRRIRLLLVAALSAAALAIPAAPASACQPDVEGGCCEDAWVNVLWRKYTGNNLFHCPW